MLPRRKPGSLVIATFAIALGLLFTPACFGTYPHASMLEPSGDCFPEPKSYVAFEISQRFEGGFEELERRCQHFRITVAGDGAAMYTNRHDHKRTCPHIATERADRINDLIAPIDFLDMETISHGCKLYLRAPRGFVLEGRNFPSELKAEVGAILKDVDPSFIINEWSFVESTQGHP